MGRNDLSQFQLPHALEKIYKNLYKISLTSVEDDQIQQQLKNNL